MFMRQDFQRIKHLTEGLIEVLVDNDHIQILLVFPLEHRRLFHLIYKLVILKEELYY